MIKYSTSKDIALKNQNNNRRYYIERQNNLKQQPYITDIINTITTIRARSHSSRTLKFYIISF